eukprot:gene1672-33066_t
MPEPSPAQKLNSQRLKDLRKLMSDAGVHAYIVPTEDPHMSEYSPDSLARRQFISDFTGSAGTVVVTLDKAFLWTDGRYFFQAGLELSPDWTLMRAGTPGCLEIEDWLAENLPEGGRVGIDPYVHTVESVRKIKAKVEDSGKELVPIMEGGNLVDKVWSADRPGDSAAPVRIHPSEWAGETVSAKLDRMRLSIKKAKADVMLVTMLDEVAWLLNLRGSDVKCNPVFLSYALVGVDGSASLYVDPSKLPEAVLAQLKEASVTVCPYADFVGDVAAKAASGQILMIDPSKLNYAVYHAAGEAAGGGSPAKKRTKVENSSNGTPAPKPVKFAVEAPSCVVAAKAIKNAAELAGLKEAHLRDAVALCEFFCWIEEEMAAGKVITEVEVDLALTARRAAQPGFIELSFPTIAGAGPNGAIMHYSAKAEDCLSVDKDTMLLLDSGGQYDCGTTDITRTMHFGTPTDRQKMAYTRVLQGHIALDEAVFPEGTMGLALDTLARTFLWKEGLNYRHGTGHGVGAALNVHEGPHSISTRQIYYPLAKDMICSNEPGYYEDGNFGVRIENLVFITEADTANKFGGRYLKFERLTLVPKQTKMMDTELLTAGQVAWVDKYHESVWEAVSPRLAGNDKVLAWLKLACRSVKEQQQQI